MSTATPTPTPPSATPSTTRKVVDTAQYAMAGFLAVVGAYTIYDASGIEPGFADQALHPATFPYVFGGVLLLLAVLLGLATARGDVPQAEEGEDVDLSTGTDLRTVGLLVAVFVVNIALIDFLGWAITGAFLFAGSAWVLGSRHPVRDVAIGVALSVGTFYGFYVGLGIPMPAGILDGIL